MPGYMLIEKNMLQPQRPKGFQLNPWRIGILDYLRELRQETFPFSRENRLRIVGLEEVLLAAGIGDNLLKVSLFIHNIFTSKANELEANMGWVQVIFRWPLKRADDFWFEPGGGQRLSLRPIFGSPMKDTNGSGNECYRAGFNLT
jgi:hypothetical protein